MDPTFRNHPSYFLGGVRLCVCVSFASHMHFVQNANTFHTLRMSSSVRIVLEKCQYANASLLCKYDARCLLGEQDDTHCRTHRNANQPTHQPHVRRSTRDALRWARKNGVNCVHCSRMDFPPMKPYRRGAARIDDDENLIPLRSVHNNGINIMFTRLCHRSRRTSRPTMGHCAI